MRALGVTSVVGPAVIILLWGGSYVYVCLITLSAGGVPVEYVYDTPAGPIKVRAANYEFDLPRNTLRLGEITVKEPDGNLLASARNVLLTDILPGRRPIRVQARHVYAYVERLANGRFRIQDFVKEQPQSESKQSYLADVEDLSILFDDHSAPERWKKWASSVGLHIDGLGSEWAASGPIKVQSAGLLQVTARSTAADGLAIAFHTSGLEVADIAKHFRATPEGRKIPELRNISLSTGQVSSDGQVAIDPKGVATWHANVEGHATNFVYGEEVNVGSVTVFAALGPDGLKGRALAQDRESAATFNGSLNWTGKTTLAGTIESRLARPGAMPLFLKRLLPKDLAFKNAALNGWLSFVQGTGVRVTGHLTAADAAWNDQRATQLNADIDVDPQRLIASNLQGAWQGSPVKGAVAYNLKTGGLVGHLRAQSAQLGSTLKRFGLTAVEGTADVRIALAGKVSSPQVIVRASGQGTSHEQGYNVRLGHFDLGGTYASSRFDLDRFTLVGPSGSATARGFWDAKKDKVDIDVLATGIPLQSFFQEVGGSAAFAGKVVGTAKSPKGIGQVEVFDAKAGKQDLPFARGDVVVDKQGITANNVLAFKRGAQATGQAGLAFKDRSIQGLFNITGIDLADYPLQGLSGVAEIRQGVLKGTLDHPALEANVHAENLVAGGVPIDEATANTTIVDNKLTIAEATATTDGGTIAASGQIDLGTQSGSFTASADAIPLRTVLANVLSEVSVGGKLKADLTGSFSNGKIEKVVGQGQLSAFKLNDAFLGNGPVTLSNDGTAWKGSLFLGDIASYIQAPELTYNPDTRQIEGDIVSDNFKAGVIYDSLKRYLIAEDGTALIPDEMRVKLESFRGRVDLDAHVAGKIDSPDLDINALSIERMSISGQQAGQLTAKGSRHNEVWSIDAFNWTGGPALVSLKPSTIDENGDISIDGDIKNLDWKWLATFKPEFAKVPGRSDLPFLVQGKTASPEIHASFSYEEGSAQATITPWPGVAVLVKNSKAKTRRVELENVAIKDGSIEAQGVFNLEGFTGTIEAKVPFRYPFEIPENEPITAFAKIPERPLASLTEVLPWLDAKKTEGNVVAGVQITGTKSDLHASGSFDAIAKSLGIRDIATTIQDLGLHASFNDKKVSLSANGNSSGGGSFATEDVGFSLDNLEDAFKESFSVLLQNRLYGTFRLNEFRMDYVDKQSGPMMATVSGALGLDGTLAEPRIAGQLLLNNADLATPSITASTEVPPPPIIDPKFDISFYTANNLKLRAATGLFELSGGGKLAGSLSSPVFNSAMEVEKGNIRLPNARITIEPGGTVGIEYRPGFGGQTVSRVDVDLVGHTQVSAESLTGVVERYDVILNIRGDLLSETGLQLDAQSDPPDLSQDRILAILGQGDILAGRPGEGFRPDRQIQSALLGLAVPYFASNFTEQLANTLGLDYVNLEYNTFDQFSVTAAVSLGRDFVLSGRRQISAPIPGEKLKYDVRLSYRPPFRNKALRRFTFSVGTDQDRPWKISVEYGIRF